MYLGEFVYLIRHSHEEQRRSMPTLKSMWCLMLMCAGFVVGLSA